MVHGLKNRPIGRAFFNIQSGGTSPPAPSIPNQWNIFGPPIKSLFSPEKFVLLFASFELLCSRADGAYFLAAKEHRY